ncbi:MAG: hypothetical protein AAF591_06660 [Verrucomicrobiota bacterium]
MNRRKAVILSVVLSVGLHLLLAVVAVLLVGFGSMISSEQAQAKPASEVVMYFPQIMVEAPVEPAPEEEAARQQFIRTSEENRTDERPEAAPFYSDKSTLAQSEMDADPEANNNLPSREGMEDVPFQELADREYVDGEALRDQAGSAPSQPAMAVPPSPLAPPMELIDVEDAAEEAREGEGEADELPASVPMEERSFADALDIIEAGSPREADAMRDTTGRVEEEMEERESETEDELKKLEKEVVRQEPMEPTPALPPQTPAPEVMPLPGEAGFTPHTRATAMRGSLSNTGKSASVLAEETPLGRYKQAVSAAIGRLWHRYRQDNMDFVVFGSLKLEFKIDPNGTPRELKVTDNDANEIMANFSMRAVMDADIPPMPEEIIGILDDGMLEVTYDVIIY